MHVVDAASKTLSKAVMDKMKTATAPLMKAALSAKGSSCVAKEYVQIHAAEMNVQTLTSSPASRVFA